MSDLFDKLDFGLIRLYTSYLESKPSQGAETSGPAYNLALRYSANLAEIERLGFETTWSDLEGFAHGLVRLHDLEKIAAHPDVISLSYGSEPELHLDHSASDIQARADTVANIGVNGLWHVDKSTGALAAASVVSGKDVIVGVIDTGIDIDHPVFMKSLSPYATRILRIWDQGLNPVPADGEVGPDKKYLTVANTYGVEFKNTQIDNHLNNHVPLIFRHRDCVGHGTHVAATAAGNGNPGEGIPLIGSPGSFDFVGIAPQADIIAVKFLDVKRDIKDTAGNPVSPTTRVRDAVMYILKVAEELGKSAVINCSFGSSLGPHDGLTEDELFFDGVFAPAGDFHEGYILVYSAGNSGGRRQHAEITLPASGEVVIPFELFDTRGGMQKEFRECAWKDETRPLFVDLWYREVSAPDDVSAAVKVPTEGAFSGDVFSGFLTKTFDGNKKRTLFHTTNPVVTRPSAPGPGVPVRRNNITLSVEPNKLSPPMHRTGVYEIRIKGPAGLLIHAWTLQPSRRYGFRVGPSTTIRTAQAAGATALDVTDTSLFVVGDSISIQLDDGSQHTTTISSITAGAPGILNIASALPSAAASGKGVVKGLPPEIQVTDRCLIASDAGTRNAIAVAAYDDKNGNTADPQYANLASFSSRGPLADYSGLGPLIDKPDIAGPGVAIHAAQSRHKDGVVLKLSELFGNRFIDMQGTSMSAPHISGVIALMLEAKSDLTVDEIRTIFRSGASVRAGTRPIPADGAVYQQAYGGGIVDAKKTHTALP